jgi:hypothetical protein
MYFHAFISTSKLIGYREQGGKNEDPYFMDHDTCGMIGRKVTILCEERATPFFKDSPKYY